MPRSPYSPLVSLALLLPMIAPACQSHASVKMHEAFNLGDLSYTVQERKSQGQFVVPLGGEAIDAGRDATFVLIGLEITNNGKTTSAVSMSSFELETSDGARYTPDLRGTAAHAVFGHPISELRTDDPRGAILRPQIPTPYTVVFRIPYRLASANLTLIVHQPAMLFGAAAAVELQ